MERRLRKMSRPRLGTCEEAIAGKYRKSSALEYCAGDGRLHPVPFSGSTAQESHQCQVLRLARRLSGWSKFKGFLETRRTQVGRADLHSFCRWHGAQKPHAGK